MSPLPYDPNFRAPDPTSAMGDTDLGRLLSEPAAAATSASTHMVQKEKVPDRTDFEALKGAMGQVAYTEHRTATEWLIDFLTPFFIFVMTYTVIYFLLDVRFVYTEIHNGNLRFVALCFVVGVVALNRLIARDGSGESFLYMVGLGGMVGLYTIGAPDINNHFGDHESSGISTNLSLLSNMTVVIFIWWVVNRLTHECCVDENESAGDVGILTGTARKFQKEVRYDPEAAKEKKKRRDVPMDVLAPMYQYDAFDPVEGYKPKAGPKAGPARGTLADRRAKRHPGMSIFYFSVPVMVIFALGLRVVQHGGVAAVLRGQWFMILYTVAALMLLMLRSLGGLREYFRARKVRLPAGLGWYWIGLGTVMVAMVVVAALRMPMPGLPAMAYVPVHKTDFWTRGSTFELKEYTGSPEDVFQQSVFMEYLGDGVLGVFGLFLLYALAKGIGALAVRIGQNRNRFPGFVVRFFNALDLVLSRLTKLPTFPKRKRRVRIQRDIAVSAKYVNSMGEEGRSNTFNTNEHIEYAYEAMCALANDLGVPRALAQTPYEFLEQFPKPLDGLRKHAEDLTRLYVLAAYSEVQMDEKVRDRLREFWMQYNKIRNRVVR
jgi:hypothetical protein